MLFNVPLAVEVAYKEIDNTLVFRSAASMQIAVLAQGRKTACSKEMPSPVPQKSPEKVGTHNISPIVPGFFSVMACSLQALSSFSTRSKKYPSLSGFHWFLLLFESSAFRIHFQNLQAIPLYSFLQCHCSFMVSSPAQDISKAGNSISPQRMEFSAFMGCWS